MNNLELAEKIYSNFYGDVDNKYYYAETIQEIVDWLTEGNPENMTFEDLLAEWSEYIMSIDD